MLGKLVAASVSTWDCSVFRRYSTVPLLSITLLSQAASLCVFVCLNPRNNVSRLRLALILLAMETGGHANMEGVEFIEMEGALPVVAW